jgi:hypothetical protein
MVLHANHCLNACQPFYTLENSGLAITGSMHAWLLSRSVGLQLQEKEELRHVHTCMHELTTH